MPWTLPTRGENSKQRVVESASCSRSCRRAVPWTAGRQTAGYMAQMCREGKEAAPLGSVAVKRWRNSEGTRNLTKIYFLSKKRKMGKFCYDLSL